MAVSRRGPNLTSAHLYLAGLRAGLTNAKLQLVWLTYANLSGANLYHANLRNSNVRNADMSGATWIDGRECAYGSIGGCYRE